MHIEYEHPVERGSERMRRCERVVRREHIVGRTYGGREVEIERDVRCGRPATTGDCVPNMRCSQCGPAQ